MLARRAWGQGFATEGAKESLIYAFEHLKLERVVSITHSENLRSLYVMQRIGLSTVGRTNWNGFESVWSAMGRTTWERDLQRGKVWPKEVTGLGKPGEQSGQNNTRSQSG